MKKVLLDENNPRPLKHHFSKDFEIYTVPDLKWQSLKNGDLLKAMEKEGFEILITADRNLSKQHNLKNIGFQIVVLISYDNRYKTIVNWVTTIENKIRNLKPSIKCIEIDLRN